MKITDRLIEDHKTFRNMLRELDEIERQPLAHTDAKRLIRAIELFKDHLLFHAWYEDQFYYPVIYEEISRFQGGPLSASYMKHLEYDHKSVDGYLERLEQEVKKEPLSADWPLTYARFRDGLEAHMRKEEQELFPESERVLGSDRLEALAEGMERRRSEAPRVRLHARL